LHRIDSGDLQVAADGPTQFPHSLLERGDARLSFRIVRGKVHQHADAAHLLALLRPRRERPSRRAAEQRDNLATLQLMEMHRIPQARECIARISDCSGSVSGYGRRAADRPRTRPARVWGRADWESWPCL
jgi:hypothetical protein